MTYGWAILVVLVALGALAYFGFLSPDRFLPSKCTLGSGLSCVDHVADSVGNDMQVIIRNGLGFDAAIVSVTIENCATVLADGGDDCAAGATPTMTNGAQCSFTSTVACSPALVSGGKYSGDFTVVYTNTETGIQHTNRGTITTRAE